MSRSLPRFCCVISPTLTASRLRLPADVDELKKLVLTLQKQLAAAGVDPTAASISLDKAKEMLHAALTRLMDGDQKAQGEYDKWDQRKLIKCSKKIRCSEGKL